MLSNLIGLNTFTMISALQNSTFPIIYNPYNMSKSCSHMELLSTLVWDIAPLMRMCVLSSLRDKHKKETPQKGVSP